MIQGNENSGMDEVIIRQFIIANELGLHLRPAGLLVKTANKYKSAITIEKGGVEADGKSIIQIATLNAARNSTITIKACGPDACARHRRYPRGLQPGVRPRRLRNLPAAGRSTRHRGTHRARAGALRTRESRLASRHVLPAATLAVTACAGSPIDRAGFSARSGRPPALASRRRRD